MISKKETWFLAVFALCASAVQAQDAHPSRFLVQTAVDAPVLLGGAGQEFARTGIPEIDRLNARYGVVEIEPLYPEQAGQLDPRGFQDLGLDRTWVFHLTAELDTAPIATEYDALASVQYAEPDFHVDHMKTPNDPRWNDQWNLRLINCPRAWNMIDDSTGTVVAVIDTGIDMNHDDIKKNRWKNPGEIANNNIDDDNNGYVDDTRGYDFANSDENPDDDNGHGTHVSAITGASTDNNLHVAGINWVAEIQSLKALDQGGSGFISDIAEAVTYATDNSARVINMSLGTTSDTSTLRNAVNYAGNNDVVQVASAGNNGNQTKIYPAAYDAVMAIISVDKNDNKSSFSTFGSWCSMSAPGEDILSLWNNGATATISGTSQASPHVAGVATLVRSLHPELDRHLVQQVLEQSSKDLGASGKDNSFGFGRLDATRAVRMANALRAGQAKVSDGESVDFTLDYDDAKNHIYILLPGRNGHLPGIDLSIVDPNEVRFLPVNNDSFLQNFLLTHPFNGIFHNFIGTLDNNGQATATLFVPKHFWIGEEMHFAYVTFDPVDLTTVGWVSTGVKVKVTD